MATTNYGDYQLAGEENGGYNSQLYPNPGVVSRNPDGSPRINYTDPPVSGIPAPTAQADTPVAPATSPRSGNVQQDWTNFLQGKGYTGQQGRTALPQYVNEFNQAYGYNAKAGNPNASGTIDSIDFGNGAGWTDVIHGGDDAWQWLVAGNGQGQGRPSGVNGPPSFADLLNVPQTPFQPAAFNPSPRNFNASDILNQSNPNAGREQSLMDLLSGIASGSRPESANPNFTINPNDPIIKNQVDAFSASRQRADRNALDALAEKEGTHANIGAETRHAAEATGQATAEQQATLIGQELSQRRQEAEQSLALYSQYMTADQQRQAQMQIEQLRNAESQYEFDTGLGQSNAQFNASLGQNNSQFTAAQLQAARQFAATLGQNAYQFDTNQEYLRSPLNG